MTNDTKQQVMETLNVDVLVQRCLRILQEKKQSNENEANSNESNNNKSPSLYRRCGHSGIGKIVHCRNRPRPHQQATPEQRQHDTNDDASNHDLCVVIPMDGYHLTRKQLQEKADAGEPIRSDQFKGPNDNGKQEETTTTGQKIMSYDELMMRRGAPFTYDWEAFRRDLLALQDNDGKGSFPVYDRSEHDPVPNALSVTSQNQIILVEGLYLLCFDDPDLEPLAQLYDDRWFVEVSLEETKRRLIQRHLENWNDDQARRWGGTGHDAAERKAESNDMLNAACIRKHSEGKAYLVIENETIPNDSEDSNSDDNTELKREKA